MFFQTTPTTLPTVLSVLVFLLAISHQITALPTPESITLLDQRSDNSTGNSTEWVLTPPPNSTSYPEIQDSQPTATTAIEWEVWTAIATPTPTGDSQTWEEQTETEWEEEQEQGGGDADGDGDLWSRTLDERAEMVGKREDGRV